MMVRCGNLACNHVFDQTFSGTGMCGDCMAEWRENNLATLWVTGGAWDYMVGHHDDVANSILWSFLFDLTYEMR